MHLSIFIEFNDVRFYIDSEEVYCADAVNATIDTQEFDICLTMVKDKERDEQTKRTWFSIVCMLAAFFVTFISKSCELDFE